MNNDYNDWVKNLDAHIEVIVKGSKKALEMVAKEFTEVVKERTPVGNPELWKSAPRLNYIPGALRKAWYMDSILNGYRIGNPMVYAHIIEYGGWSTQAPYGMMRLTIRDVPEMLAKAKKKEGL